MTSIPNFFAGQSLLVTGGTGFLGKVLIEKLLRSCPDISRLYLLVRCKKGVSVHDRWKKLTTVALFDRLKGENPKALEKVIPIECNLSEKNLGLSEENEKELIENVTVIFHVAATIQFNNNIIDTLKENTRATYLLLELAKLMKNLKVFTYVSTTYCNYNRPEEEWDEQVYPAPLSWRMILELLDKEELSLSILKGKILFGHPNAYTLSKSLAENIIQDYSQLFPAVIVRPSLVTCTLDEPMIGWLDGLHGIASLCLGTGLGIVRLFWANDDDHHAYIPVDKVANTLAIATWNAHASKNFGLEVYNCTCTKGVNIVKVKDYCTYLKSDDYVPSKHIIWAPSYQSVQTYWKFYILFLLKMVLPFTFVDLFLRISGKKPRLIKIAVKIMVAVHLFEPFLFGQIGFPNKKYLELEKLLQGKDKEDFKIKIPQIDVMNAIKINLTGALKFYFHEELNERTLRRNRDRLRRSSSGLCYDEGEVLCSSKHGKEVSMVFKYDINPYQRNQIQFLIRAK